MHTYIHAMLLLVYTYIDTLTPICTYTHTYTHAIPIYIYIPIQIHSHPYAYILIYAIPICIHTHIFAQLAGAVEYINCTSAEGYNPPPPNECPEYDTKQSDGEVPVMLELWGMQSTLSLPSLAWGVSTWYGPIYGSNRTKLRTYAKLNCLKYKSFYI